MCGRFVQSQRAERYAELLGGEVREAPEPGYNRAPTDWVLAAVQDREGRVVLGPLRWGLVPHWSAGPDPRFSMINARAESVHEKPAFRDAFRRHRCLIPADGFYEWRTENGRKQPYYIRRRDGAPLMLAGLWAQWQGGEERIASCTVVVTDANELVRPLHERMPVILPPAAWSIWLDPDRQAIEPLRALLIPMPGEDLEAVAVSTRVNTPRNDGPELIEPLDTHGDAAPG